MGNRSGQPQYRDRENPNSLGGGGRLLLRGLAESDRRQKRFVVAAVVGVLALPLIPVAIAALRAVV